MKEWLPCQQIRNLLKFLENEKAETCLHVYKSEMYMQLFNHTTNINSESAF